MKQIMDEIKKLLQFYAGKNSIKIRTKQRKKFTVPSWVQTPDTVHDGGHSTQQRH